MKKRSLSLITLASCALLYAANGLWLRGRLPFFAGYFNDILAGCVIVSIASLLLVLAGLKPLKKLWQCLGLCLLAGLFWELVTPLYLPGSVGDPWDMAAYLTGALIWYLLCRMVKP